MILYLSCGHVLHKISVLVQHSRYEHMIDSGAVLRKCRAGSSLDMTTLRMSLEEQ